MKIVKKLKQKKGETLTETLSSLLIIVPGMVMLAGAIVAASKINDQVKKSDVTTLPRYDVALEDVRNLSISIEAISQPGTATETVTIKLGKEPKDGSSYYYYSPSNN